MKLLRAVSVSLACALSAAACASAPSPTNSAPAHLQSPATTVQVTNNNWATMAVYVVRSGMRTRIGTVESMRTAVLRVPPVVVAAAGSIQLLMDPIGAPNRYLTPMIQVTPGQRIEVQVENHLPLSSISVWNR